MKVLFIGDIVGSPGRRAVKQLLPGLIEEHSVDFVIANAENASGGSGIVPKVAEELFSFGVDVLTSGDHIWKKKEIFELISYEKRVLRPLNFPALAPGRGSSIFKTKDGREVGVINVNGRTFMEALESPFTTALAAQEELAKETKIIIVDIHAEATSEKIALGWYLDGKVSAVLGTHTHIQTADEKVLPQGTAYITDVGMCGPYASVIGRKVDQVLERFLTSIPVRFEVAEGNIQLHGVVLDVDDKTGRARSLVRIQKKLSDE
ncbi:MAG: TIGR00282 family metallophosphoesterase [Candidatus Omnitrophica bacterium]|nr:TIGR00282 family metallophosphoesterase [Candidatus Omnitrophota bacterium]MDD5661553.1 TIGR00282 family metallophosphoesterase [Candidatus Omnitrophota bacterium]